MGMGCDRQTQLPGEFLVDPERYRSPGIQSKAARTLSVDLDLYTAFERNLLHRIEALAPLLSGSKSSVFCGMQK
jgi:hypothetical protein